MVTRVRLVSADVEVVARDKGPDWWEVEIRAGGVTHVLGADAPSIVVSGLRKAVATGLPGPVAGTLGGLPVAWAFTLREMHGSVYVADAEERRVVCFQDRDAQLLATATLSSDERTKWQRQLDSVSTSGPGRADRGRQDTVSPPQ